VLVVIDVAKKSQSEVYAPEVVWYECSC